MTVHALLVIFNVQRMQSQIDDESTDGSQTDLIMIKCIHTIVIISSNPIFYPTRESLGFNRCSKKPGLVLLIGNMTGMEIT